jgi:hypothetical protein
LGDEQVVRIRDRGRKGWVPAFRDATLFKVAYAFGLRRNDPDAGRGGRWADLEADRRQVRRGAQTFPVTVAALVRSWFRKGLESATEWMASASIEDEPVSR